MTEFTHFKFKHYQLPVTIIWRDPKESFVRGMKILLKDIEENGIERWNITSSIEEDDCCPAEEFEV